jgi:rod shape determining protein RodA
VTETILMQAERVGIRRPSFAHIDWVLFISALLLSFAGLITMNSFSEDRYFFDRQLMWIGVSVVAFFVAALSDWRFLRRTSVVVSLFAGSSALLLLLMVFGTVAKGAQSWFDLGGFSFQPSDPVKLVLITVLAKYFSRRHVEIAHVRHIILSAAYAAILAVLILIQPDFGSAIIFAAVWFGMVLLSGISKKHLLAVLGLGAAAFAVLWLFVFQPYQKQRIITFIHPLADIRGAGYNAFQSTIAVGSGQIMGKGIGFGTQSKLQFLPEYETDFIFAAFAEEWGLVGSLLVFVLFAIVIARLISSARTGASNFETLFSLGLAILFLVHIIVHVGMNIGLLPVTGTTVPFMSYGGSHLLTEFLGIGIVTGMRKYRRGADRTAAANELPGLYGA